MINIQLLFVVETNEAVKSDDAYFGYLLKYIYGDFLKPDGKEGIHFDYRFIYMDGKGNFNKKTVATDISDYKKEYPIGRSEVIYCFDIDNTSNDNIIFYNKVYEYCSSKQYRLVISYKEIEDVLKVKSGGSKKERVKSFARNYPSPLTFDFSLCRKPINIVFNKVGQTNFGEVIEQIIKEYSNNNK